MLRKNLKIEGLNKRQIRLLKKMWELDSADDLLEWTTTLSDNDRLQVVVLIELIKMELIEEKLEEMTSFRTANYYINRTLRKLDKK